MTRREFTSALAAPDAAGSAGTPAGNGSAANAPATNGSAANGAAAIDQRILLRAIGLNAFIVEDGATAVHIAMLNPVSVSIGTGHMEHTMMSAHVPTLVIANASLVDPTAGTEVTAEELRDKLRFRTTTTAFRAWDLTGKTLTIDNATGPELETFTIGEVPMRRLNPGGSLAGWETKPVVGVTVTVDKGLFRDGPPRTYENDVQLKSWKFTTLDFELEPDIPTRLTDTVEIELAAAPARPLTFTITNGSGASVVATAGDVEAYLVCLPVQLTEIERQEWDQLHHVLAGYELFQTQPLTKPIPKTKRPSGISDNPVFCPGLWFDAS